MALVAGDGNFHLLVVRKSSLVASLVRLHSDLHTSRHGLVLFAFAVIASLEAGAERVHIKEGVFAVLYASHRVPVERLMALVPSSRQVHVSLLLRNFNSLEPKTTSVSQLNYLLSIVEISGVYLVLYLSRLDSSVKTSELFFAEFGCGSRCEAIGLWGKNTLDVFTVNSASSSVGE